MKHVLKGHEVPHLWAHQTQESARNPRNNISFRGKMIYSYSTEMGMILEKDKAVVLNSNHYSNTTSKQQSWIWGAVSHYPIQFLVPFGRRGSSAPTGREIADYYRQNAVANLVKRARAITYKEGLATQAEVDVDKFNKANTYFRLRRKGLTVESLAKDVEKGVAAYKAELKQTIARNKVLRAERRVKATAEANQWLTANDGSTPSRWQMKGWKECLPSDLLAQIETRLQQMRAAEVRADIEAFIAGGDGGCGGWKAKMYRGECPDDLKTALEARLLIYEREQEEQQRKREIERAAERAEDIEAWKRGENTHRSLYDVPVMLRAKDGVMETSRGVSVPIEDAERTYRFAAKVKALGWHRNGQTHAIGSYQLDSVTSISVQAGCHEISWDEISRFAALMGWAEAVST